MADVAVVDLSLPEEQAAQLVRQACTGPGFFYVSNHGVAQSLTDDTFSQTRSLFAIPQEEKQRLIADENSRGWTPFQVRGARSWHLLASWSYTAQAVLTQYGMRTLKTQEETLDPANQTIGDTKEGFYFGREVSRDSPEAMKPLHGPNQWPGEQLVPGLRATYQRYFAELSALGMRLLRLIALALDLPPTYFHSYFEPPMIMMRPLHYSGQVSSPGDGIFGAGAHTDYGMLTILATDGVPGLQIHLAGTWVDVQPVPGTFIINLGDMLERWTNGDFKSTLHRVINTAGKERYSIAFFFEPAFDAVVECLPQCCGPDRPPKYPATTAGQHLLDKYAATHAGYTGPKQAGDSKHGGKGAAQEELI